MIVGIVGNQGKGKTALEAWLAKHYFELGFKIHCNFFLHGVPGLVPHFITTLKDIDAIHDGYAILDEFWGFCADSRQSWSEVNQTVTDILSNARKREYNIIYEAKRASFVDVRIREQTNYFLHPCIMYQDDTGQLVHLQQNLLYPVQLKPLLSRLWVYVDQTQVEGTYERDMRQPFWFQLEPVTKTYNTKQEIQSLIGGKGEWSPGIEKGMIIEDHFAIRIKDFLTDAVILRNGNSRGWDLFLANYPFAFDSVSPTNRYGSWHLDVRGKKIDKLLTEAQAAGKQGFYLWKTDDYYVMPMLPEHATRTSLACSRGTRLEDLLNEVRHEN
jgi:hypothetical protein